MSYRIIRESIGRNAINYGCRYHVIEEGKLRGEMEMGWWNHDNFSIFNTPFLTEEEALKAVEELESKNYIVVTCFHGMCDSEPFVDRLDNSNIIDQPSIFTIHFQGTEDECEDFIKKEF